MLITALMSVCVAYIWLVVVSKFRPQKIKSDQSMKVYRDADKYLEDLEGDLLCKIKNVSMEEAAEWADQVTKSWSGDVGKLNDILGSDYDEIIRQTKGKWNATAIANCAHIALNSPEPYKSIAKKLYLEMIRSINA